MSTDTLVRMCAPTLAGMKTGSLFTQEFKDEDELHATLDRYNGILEPKGLKIVSLGLKIKRHLLYLYRPAQLSRDLNDVRSRELLSTLGYCCENCEQCLKRLQGRIGKEKDFPHEVGFFLGYPYCDVKGFMEHRKCLAVGPWKVFENKDETCALFEKYRCCQRIYDGCVRKGMSLSQLIVKI